MLCASNTREFKPRMALSVFPKLMNTMILHIMKGQIHASVKALEGYCAFHQMFLKFLETYPELHQECRDLVHGFLKSEEARHKTKVESLGEFMCYLTVTPEVQWKDIASLLINEQSDRQVMWIIKVHALPQPPSPHTHDRTRTTAHTCLTFFSIYRTGLPAPGY